MPKRIEKLKLTQFRGGCQTVVFDFKPDKNVVLIFGENGTGKSSIVDAIDFVCNNEFGSLRDRSGTTPKTHVVSQGGQAQELAVKMRYGGKDWEAKLQGGKPVTQPPGPPRAFILRRTDITRVMEAAPAERYKALHAYITVAKVEEAEGELRKAYKAMQDGVDRAAQSRTQAVATLESLWRLEGSPSGDAMQWATRKVSVRIDAQRLTLEANRRLSEGINQAMNARAALRTAEKAEAAATAALATARAALQTAAGEQTKAGAALLALLTDTRRYLEDLRSDVQICPVCGQPAEAAALLQRVEEQLRSLAALQQLREDEQRAEQMQMQAQGSLRSAQQTLVTQCRSLAGLALDAAPEYAEVIDNDALAAASGDPPRLAAALAALEELTAAQAALTAAIGENEKTVHLWNALQAHLQAIGAAETTVREQEAVAQRLKALLAIVETERKSYVDQLVRAISGDVNALYARIHPHEPLGSSSLYVKPNVAGSLELRATFGGAADVVPGAYYSEAHLDTLGLCVYLALARRGDGHIVVLDDVLTSVDEPHMERIVDLLAQEAKGLGQLIITTHSRTWCNRVRSGKGMDADLIELYNWGLTQGIQHDRVPLYGDELRQVLQGGRLDRQAAAAKAGVLLEQLLDEIVFLYGCRVPHKRGAAFTLGELADSLRENKKLGPVLKVETQIDDGTWRSTLLKELIDNCTKYVWVRNMVGAHFNVGGDSVPDTAVREFAANVLLLAEALACPHCRQLPTKNKSGEYWECGGGCGKMRLRPLRGPE